MPFRTLSLVEIYCNGKNKKNSEPSYHTVQSTVRYTDTHTHTFDMRVEFHLAYF